jgi:periplasmic copper chaperone A
MKKKYMNQLIGKLILIAVLSFSIAPAYAHKAIEITNVSMPEVRAVSRTVAIYFTLLNNSIKDAKLVGVSTDVARHAMFHLSKEVNGVAKMQHMNELIIPANSKLVFRPGSYHIMLMGIDHQLLSKPFVVNLVFSDNTTSQFKVDNLQGNK